MAVATDLTWDQLKTIMVQNGVNSSAIVVLNGKLMIDVSLITGSTINATAMPGVVKFVIRLLDFCLKTQKFVNEDKTDGERLGTFSVSKTGDVVSGHVSVTHSTTARYDLGSATEIIGIIH